MSTKENTQSPPPLPPRKYPLRDAPPRRGRAWEEVVSGFKLALASLWELTYHAHLTRRLLVTVLWLTVVYIATEFITQYILLLPFRLIHSFSTQQAQGRIVDLMDNVELIGRRLPLLLLQGLQYSYPQFLDQAFLEGALFLEPELHARLSTRPYHRRYWRELMDFCRRSWKRAQFSLVILVLSPMPLIGPYILPMVGFYLTARAFGKPFALIIAATTLIPLTRPLAHWALEVGQDARQLGRELLEPYFCREALKPRERRIWLRYWGWRVFGYGLLYIAWVRIPWIGLGGYLAGQMALSVLLGSIPFGKDGEVLLIEKKTKAE
ncbi:hypothetical protein BJ684DRAFT_17078 [Piptocephalis cylindrospora]|uniref:Etoposide-induced protein 2.4-domain-containing protein n=1 Tax=Piptocephalis cylindrospora TaxID=1907219 RepID=A0A4P9Y2X2_9FUNG|nr:hypothetical protein BJ684DRAFT_17078 [Piptocephalis cylindrospora]|eukprot:RKP12431.1 hypothetical protein BJ684DRAFT_17078 [Piptocephalis cylindrospora]